MQASCYHCQNKISGNPLGVKESDGSIKNFCCKACLTIWELITEKQLGEFYTYRGKKRTTARPGNPKPGFNEYDSESLFSQFVQTRDGLSEASFLLEGLACAACVWLTEKVITDLNGVRFAKVNFSNCRATVKWETKKVALGKIISTFGKYGFYARPYVPSAELGQLSSYNRSLLYKLGVAGFAAGNVMLFYISIYLGIFYGMEERIRLLFEWLSLVLSTPALFFSASPLTTSMLAAIRQKRINMDFPIVVALYTTYVYSAFALFNRYDPYFDTLSLFLFLILLGRYIQGRMQLRCLTVSDSLKQLKIKSARTLGKDKTCAFKPVNQVAAGTIVQVRPGETLPLDGIIHLNIPVTIDESMISGESIPVFKERNSLVLAGTSLVEGELIYRTTKTDGENRIDEILRLLSRKDDSISRFMTFSDRAASWFTVCVLLLSTSTYLFWLLKGHETPLLTALSVLIVTCPCAFSLAIPMAQAVANHAAYSEGILIKSFDAYELFSKATHMVFDKTGTLTYGKMEIEKIKMVDETFSEEEMLKLLYPLEQESRHPVARAILRNNNTENAYSASGIQNIHGVGVSGIVNGKQVLAGNLKMFIDENISIPAPLKGGDDNRSVIYCGVNRKIIGKITFRDLLKPNLRELSEYLRSRKIAVSLLTGDSRSAAGRAADAFWAENVETDSLPEDKMFYIEKIKNSGNTVIMVGDGFNDTPAFSKADLSVACSTTLDSPLEVADIVLLNDDILSLKYFHRLSLKCMKIIRQNLGIALIYNAIALPLAISGHISPIIAAILMPLSSITVLINTKRITGGKQVWKLY